MAPSTTARPLVLLCLSLGIGLSLLPHAAAVSSTADLTVDFDAVPVDADIASVGTSGTATLSTSVVTAGSGHLDGATSRAGQGGAARFPTFDPSGSAMRAVLRVSNAGSADQLSPGAHDFSWAADFRLDASSYAAATGTTDNGDNLVQRGLAGSGRQFKLELDAHRPACRVEGGTAALKVVLPVSVDPSRWYRATCTRVGAKVTVALAQYDDAGAVVATWRRSATRLGGFGDLTWGSASVPLSVGGKLTKGGTLVGAASDQFNGVVDNVVLDISD